MFGRVTPEAKRALLHALQGRGEVVAMTGDGVNDTLALKDSDLGIAMGSGTPAAKSVSELVLLDNRFSTLPSVVAEGRRVIANIERVARLFVTKNAWAAVVAVLTGIFTVGYPHPAPAALGDRRADDRHARASCCRSSPAMIRSAPASSRGCFVSPYRRAW